MKNTRKMLMLFLAGTLFLLPSCDKDKEPEVIDFERHYEMVYMLGAAADGHWDSADPLPMTATADKDVFVYELDLVRSAENKLIKFSVDVNTWDKTHFLVPALENMVEGQAYAYLKEGENKLAESSVPKDGDGNLRDHFFGMDKGTSGRYKIEINPIKLTLKATKLSSLADPEIVEWVEGNLYMVGDAAPAGWAIASPTPMVRNGNIHTFEGALKAGEFKIATVFDWGGDFYRPAVDQTEISKSGIADGTVVCWKEDAAAGHGDNKWRVKDAGKYRLTLNTETLTLKVEWLGE